MTKKTKKTTVKKIVNVCDFHPHASTGTNLFIKGAIALMESQIETMRGNIAALKTTKVPKEKKKKDKREKPPVASSSKGSSKHTKARSGKKNRKAVLDNDVLTFEQKKDLSESIAKLDEVKLEKVIQIIHEGVPEIRDVSALYVKIYLMC